MTPFATSAEIAALEQNPWLSKMAYGNALERLVAQDIRNSSALSELFEYVGGPNKPDFRGIGAAQGLFFEVTTVKGIPSHLSRPYGPNIIVTPYESPID